MAKSAQATGWLSLASLVDVEMGKGGDILSFKDVLGQNVNANVEVIGQEPEEAWGRHCKCDLLTVCSSMVSALSITSNVGAPTNLGAIFFAGVEREGDIIRSEIGAITPLDALAGLDCQLFIVIRVRIALCQPHVFLVGKGTIKCQWFVDQVEPNW